MGFWRGLAQRLGARQPHGYKTSSDWQREFRPLSGTAILQFLSPTGNNRRQIRKIQQAGPPAVWCRLMLHECD